VLNVVEANVCFSGQRPDAKHRCSLGISINSRIKFRIEMGKTFGSGNRMANIPFIFSENYCGSWIFGIMPLIDFQSVLVINRYG